MCRRVDSVPVANGQAPVGRFILTTGTLAWAVPRRGRWHCRLFLDHAASSWHQRSNSIAVQRQPLHGSTMFGETRFVPSAAMLRRAEVRLLAASGLVMGSLQRRYRQYPRPVHDQPVSVMLINKPKMNRKSARWSIRSLVIVCLAYYRRPDAS